MEPRRRERFLPVAIFSFTADANLTIRLYLLNRTENTTVTHVEIQLMSDFLRLITNHVVFSESVCLMIQNLLIFASDSMKLKNLIEGNIYET